MKNGGRCGGFSPARRGSERPRSGLERGGDFPLLYKKSLPPLLQLKSAGVELVIGALLVNQLLVAAGFDDASVIQYDDFVGVADCGKAVGNYKNCAAFHQVVHAGLNYGFGSGVD